jgi:methylmalonyl-CoA mutase N-terminal domain/subunit
MDEALALPSEKAVTIALRTQQIIAEESGAANTVDPLGGSYFVEALTNKIEAQARDYFRRIEDLGGVLPAINAGFFQQEIADAAYVYQREIDAHTRTIVGVNEYADDARVNIPILQMDPQGEARQIARLKTLRETRDNGRVGQTLDRLRLAAQGTENTMPYILDCVRAYCTLSEMMEVMKAEFGVYEEPIMV